MAADHPDHNNEVQKFIDDDDYGRLAHDIGAATTNNNFGMAGAHSGESLSRSFSHEKSQAKKQPTGAGVLGSRVA